MITIIIKEEDMQAESAATRNTRQKAAIESAVLSSCDHPTALTVCERVKKTVPGISLGTVYRVLGMLVKEGKVREIFVPDAPSRFDKTTRTHAHFLCASCGALTDIDVDGESFLRHAKECCGDAEICPRSTVKKAYQNKYPTDAFIIYPDGKHYLSITTFEWLEDEKLFIYADQGPEQQAFETFFKTRYATK